MDSQAVMETNLTTENSFFREENENNDENEDNEEDNNNNDGMSITTILIYVSIIVFVILLLLALYLLLRRKFQKPKLAQRLSTSLSRRSSGSNMSKRFFSRRRSSKIGTARISRPIAVADFEKVFHHRLAQDQLNEEFRIIQEYSQSHAGKLSQRQGQLELNRPKNRFVDVIPYDHSLVRLRRECGHPPSTYINASYITSTDGRQRWIATQTPLGSTMEAFWTMVKEQRVSTIVCLTEPARDSELPVALQSHYWPDLEEELTLDELQLMTKSEARLLNGSLVIRKIRISHACNNDDEASVVTHLHLTDWADHGVPTSTDACLEAAVALADMQNVGLVHCSAGVGRTGAMLALVNLIDQISRQNMDVVDVMSTVSRLREQRPKLVQTARQYNFVYVCVNEFLRRQRNLQAHKRNVSEVEIDFR